MSVKVNINIIKTIHFIFSGFILVKIFAILLCTFVNCIIFLYIFLISFKFSFTNLITEISHFFCSWGNFHSVFLYICCSNTCILDDYLLRFISINENNFLRFS